MSIARYYTTMRSRAPFFLSVFLASFLLVPVLAHAGGVPFFGPIIPQEGNEGTCPASWGMLIVVINNIISFSLTFAIVFVAPIMIAYAGFLYVIHPYDPSGMSKAKGILINTVAGISLALAAWMIVDAVMAVLYDSQNATEVWQGLISSKREPLCLPQAGISGAPAVPALTVTPTPPAPSPSVFGLTQVTAFDCKSGATCKVSPAVNNNLNQMKTRLGSAASQYQITETGVNQTVQHASGSNNLDMSCRGPCSSEQVKAAIEAWPGNVKYETNNQADYNAMLQAGIKKDNLLLLTGSFANGVCSVGVGRCITAPHMSLYSVTNI